jgi:hypothetical protein
MEDVSFNEFNYPFLFLDKKKYFPLLTEVKICPGFSEAVPEMS